MKKRILLIVLIMVMFIPRYQFVQASETQDNTIDSDEEWVDVIDMLQEDIKKNIAEQQKQQQKQLEEVKKQEEATAKISPILVDPIFKNKFVYQERTNDDMIIVYKYNGTKKDLEGTDADFFIPTFVGHRIAYVKGGTIDLETRMAYFIDSNMTGGLPIRGGSVNTQKDKKYNVSSTGELYVTDLFHTQNPKYKSMVKEIFNKISGDILYPSHESFRPDWVLIDNYKLLMPKYRDFLAKLAVKYKICDDSETTSMKAKLALSVFYDVYNASDNLVNYDTDDNARISRIEFYTLFCKYFYGSKAVLAEYQSSFPNGKDFMNNFENKDYAPYYDYAHSASRSLMPGFITTKKVLAADITKIEVMSLIYEIYDLRYSNEEEYNKYKDKSILDYCSDIKKSQIMSFWDVCNKYFNGEYTAGAELTDVCLKNKIIIDTSQAGLIYLIDIGVLTVDSKNKLNLFNKVTYNQAITYLMNYSANRK